MKRWIVFLLMSLTLFVSQAQEPDPTENTVEWATSYYAPYVYMARYPFYRLSEVAEAQGIRFFSLAFVLGGSDCTAKWAGVVPLDGSGSYMYRFLQTDLPALRAMGGDVIVSFGGAGGSELAQVCADATALAEQYQRVIDIYGVTHLDFDIEGDDIREPETIDRRSEAIVLLEENNEQDLVISYTLPVLPTGLTPEGIAVLESATAYGVEVDVVNIMTMNFGAPEFRNKTMGENNLLAAESLFAQLQTLYPERDDEAIWGMIGLTPMVGINDSGNIFTLADAEMVSDFAMERGIRLLSLWSLDRDGQCEYVNALVDDCSGVDQEPYGFSNLFNRITGE